MKKEKKTELLQDALQYLDEDMLENVGKLRGGIVDKEKKSDNSSSEKIGKFSLKEETGNGDNRLDKRITYRGGNLDRQDEDKENSARVQEDLKKFVNSQQEKIYYGNWKKWTTLVASICILITVGWICNEILPQISISDKNHEGMQESANLNNDLVDNQSSVPHTIVDDETMNDFENNKADEGEEFSQEGEIETVNIPSNDSNGNDAVVNEVASEEVTTKPGIPQSGLIQGISIPKMKVTLPREDAEIDMIGFFIYEGRCYVQNEYMENANCVGDYIGTVKGSIDEWTKEDDYIDYTGSVGGDFYEVKGMDPEFMLCMKYENGMVETYIHNNGISLYKGSELINERLHLKDHYVEVSYFTSEEWNYQYQTQKEPTVLGEEYRTVFDRFLDAFSEGEFQWKKDVIFLSDVKNEQTHPMYEEDGLLQENSKKQEDNYHLYFTTSEGVRVHFGLLGNGYVSFHGLNEVCIRIDETLYHEIIEILKL